MDNLLQAATKVSAKENVLQEASGLIYGDRRDDYGSATESFNKIAKGWSVILNTEVSAAQVALAMAWLKVCRELNKHKRDNLVDLAGYTGLANDIQEELLDGNVSKS